MDLTALEIIRFTAQYENPDITMEDLCKVWARPSGTLYRWGFELGLKRPKRKGDVQMAFEQVRRYCEQVSRVLPPAPVRPLVLSPISGEGQQLELLILLSDLHPGRLTSSYNVDVFDRRMTVLEQRITDIAKWLRYRYNVPNLHEFDIGDFVVGENVGRNVTFEELEKTVLEQVYKVGIPRLYTFTDVMRSNFTQVHVSGVKGNHGAIGKFQASQSANWDTVMYLGREARCSGFDNVSFNIESVKWYNYATVGNITWLLVHGGQISVGGGNPYNNIATKVERWHGSLPKPFQQCAMGHFHHFALVRDAWVNATLVTDDDWSREVLGRKGDCGQLLLAISEQGIEYVFPIWLGDVT